MSTDDFRDDDKMSIKQFLAEYQHEYTPPDGLAWLSEVTSDARLPMDIEALAALQREHREQVPIDSTARLQDEVLKVLLYSFAYVKVSGRASTTEIDEAKRQIVARFHNDPMFRAFIKLQCMELMAVFERVRFR